MILPASQKPTGLLSTTAHWKRFFRARTSPTNDPSTEEIAAFVNKALANGSYGVKILGGHFPLTPKANERLVRYCQENGVYIAWHAGSTETGSDLSGVKEAVAAANGGFLHLPHINAYCRGCPEKAAALSIVVLQILEANPNIVTESYLSSRNGSNLVCDENGFLSLRSPGNVWLISASLQIKKVLWTPFFPGASR